MLILTIESCFNSTSVAIGTEEKIIDYIEIKDKNDTGRLLIPCIKTLFDKNKLPYINIDTIFIDLGPGSYTGIRIGGIVAKTISVTLNKKYYGISSLELMTFTFLQSTAINKIKNDTLIPVLDAKSDFLYSGIFNVKDGNIKKAQIPALLSTNELINNIKNYQNHRIISCDVNIIKKLQTTSIIQPEKLHTISEPTAKELLKLGIKKLESMTAGLTDNDDFIYEPLYLRRSYAEEKFNITI